MQLTSRQAAILSYIQKQVAKLGKAPSVRAIAEHFGIKSPNGVACHLARIEAKGYIWRERGRIKLCQ